MLNGESGSIGEEDGGGTERLRPRRWGRSGGPVVGARPSRDLGLSRDGVGREILSLMHACTQPAAAASWPLCRSCYGRPPSSVCSQPPPTWTGPSSKPLFKVHALPPRGSLSFSNIGPVRLPTSSHLATLLPFGGRSSS